MSGVGTVAGQTNTLHVRIGTVAGSVTADSPAFLAYARQHLTPLLAAEDDAPAAGPRIVAQLRWHERPPQPRGAMAGGLNDMQRPDRDLYTGDGRIAWFRIDDFRQLVLQAHWDGETLYVRGDYHFFLNRSSWRDRLRRTVEARTLDHRREKRFATLLYYLVYYPAIWWHETFADSHPLHAAGVAGERGAIVLAGASGVGKSTLTVALAAAGGRPLSETFLLHSGRDMAAMPEPILLDAWSRRWLDDGGAILAPAPGQFVFDRQGYHLPGHTPQAPAVALVLPRRARPGGATQISAVEAHRRISAAHQLVKDMRRYWAFAAAFEHLTADETTSGLMERRERALAALTRDVPCWQLHLAPELSRAEAIDILADICERSGGGGLAARP